MASVHDLTTLDCLSLFTGSAQPNGNSAGAATVTPAPASMTGSWGGLANTWGVVGLSPAGPATGSWGGVAYSNGTRLLVTESYDRTRVIGDGVPSTNQSIGPGAWNPFPVPAVPAPVVMHERDARRFRKAYSSQRMQPRKIRIVKR